MPQQQRTDSVVRQVASQLQELIDNFRSENGLQKETKDKPRPQNFSYEDVLRKVKYDIQNIEKEMKYIVLLSNKNNNSNIQNVEATVAELCRQTRKSLEVDVQRIVSRWLREFIEKHKKNEDVDETFKTFTRVLASCSSSGDESDTQTKSSSSSSSNFFSVINTASPQLLDANLQWLMPRALKRYAKAKEIILRLKNNQQKFLNMTKLVLDEGTTQRKQQEEKDRLLAHCRVALSDFASNLESNVKELITPNSDSSSSSIGNKISSSLSKFLPQMRENLSLAASSSSSSSNNNNNNDSSTASASSSHHHHIHQQQQHARKALVELIRSLDETSSNINDSTTMLMSASAQSSIIHHQSEEDEKKDLLSFLNEIDDDVVVTIAPSHLEKEKELEEREFFLMSHHHHQSNINNSNNSNNNNNKNNKHHRSRRNAEDADEDDEDCTSNDNNANEEEEEEVSYFDENDQFNLSGTRKPKRSNTAAIHQKERLQKELKKAQQIIDDANQEGEDRELVIEKLQQNLTRLASLVEHYSGGGGGSAVGAAAATSHIHSYHTSTAAGGGPSSITSFVSNQNNNTNEMEMLRSQVAIQEERIHHLSSSLEERTLREDSLKREVEALQASESVLKSEMTYQQAALKANADDLIVAQTALFECKEQLHKCEVSRKQYVDAYNRIREVFVQDRRYATQLYQQSQQMSQQLDQSVLLSHVEELLQLNNQHQQQ